MIRQDLDAAVIWRCRFCCRFCCRPLGRCLLVAIVKVQRLSRDISVRGHKPCPVGAALHAALGCRGAATTKACFALGGVEWLEGTSFSWTIKAEDVPNDWWKVTTGAQLEVDGLRHTKDFIHVNVARQIIYILNK